MQRKQLKRTQLMCESRGIQLQVSSYKKFKLDTVIGHPCDHTPITWQIGAGRTNDNQEFCCRYD